MGRAPPISPLSFHWCLGGAAPRRAPGRQGVEAGAEGEDGGRWRRRPQKVRPDGAAGELEGALPGEGGAWGCGI